MKRAVAIEATILECNAPQLVGQSAAGVAYTYDDRGGNRCGCAGVSEPCKAIGVNLEAPGPTQD